MKIEVLNYNKEIQYARDFPPNKIGIIKKWGLANEYSGMIVILHNDILCSLEYYINRKNGDYWGDFSKPNIWNRSDAYQDFQIDVLPVGTELKITI